MKDNLKRKAAIDYVDIHPDDDEVREEILAGLQMPQKRLPSKYFYDERGCQLFEQICRLPEYYLTRTELAIMRAHVGEMSLLIGRCVLLAEMGSGASIKTRLLLDRLRDPAAYVPVDISRSYLDQAQSDLSRDYQALEILPVCADFTRPFDLPTPTVPALRTVFYMPGSTLGNFEPAAAKGLLRQIAAMAGQAGALLIGLDLQKDREVLEAAYNDSAGVTAAFNLNLLERLNREHDADFDTDAFKHRAHYNREEGRIEMHLLSRKRQAVVVGDSVIEFEPDESIHTENSYKYDLQEFSGWAAQAGMTLRQQWTDPQQRFAVLLFRVEG